MNELKKWPCNALLAVLTVVFAYLQEVWIGTEPSFLAYLGLGCSFAIVFSWAAEVLKKIFLEAFEWSWDDVITGAAIGIFVTVIIAFACI